jgi:hypothetical protein
MIARMYPLTTDFYPSNNIFSQLTISSSAFKHTLNISYIIRRHHMVDHQRWFFLLHDYTDVGYSLV